MGDATAQSKWTGCTVLVATLLFCALFFQSESALSEDARDLDQALDESATLVQALADDELRKGNRRIPLLNKLHAVATLVSEGACEEASDKVRLDLLPKLDGCAVTGVPDKTDWITTCDAQADLHTLLSESDELVRRWCDPGVPFEEGFTTRDLSDLRVISLTIEPARVDPGDAVSALATVVNAGRVTAREPVLLWAVDGEDRGQTVLPDLAPGEEVTVEIAWTDNAPGSHWVVVSAVLGDGEPEREETNNVARALLRVSGEAAPAPDIEFDDIDFDALSFTAGGSAIVPIVVHNYGYETLVAAPIGFVIDGEPVDPLAAPGSDVLPPPLLTLAPGHQRLYELPWDEIGAGRHTVSVLLELPEDVPDREFRRVTSWSVVVAGVSLACVPGLPHHWESIGPRFLHRGSGGMPSGSVGRIDRIAFHPDNPQVLYVAAPTGGVWKSVDAGANWQPMGDALPSLNARGIAVDPDEPTIVYVATLDGARDTKGKGLHKSVDGGSTWDSFAPLSVVGNVRELVVRRTAAGAVLIYAAGDEGLLRYSSSDPFARQSVPNEWRQIKSGEIVDLLVHPTDPSTLYVSVKGGVPRSGVFRTRIGAATATDDDDWTAIDAGLTPGKLPTLDLYPGDPHTLYAAVVEPDGPAGGIEQKPWLAIFRSPDEGTSWPLLKFERIGGRNGYNDFIRAHPNDPDLVYFGGVKLYKDHDMSDWDSAPVRVLGVHDDMKDLRFDPFAPDAYYVLNDGGVFRCTVTADGADSCGHRNKDLRTTQFFDIDASPNNSDLMLGGTQDNGTLLYTGFPEWDSVFGGDGLFALVARDAGNRILYAQHQFLEQTARCDLGGNCWWGDWHRANGRDDDDEVTNGNELPRGDNWGWMNAFITVHPNDPDRLLSQGPEVYSTSDGGKNWHPSGPAGTIDGTVVSGFVRRVAFQPVSTRWIAGTSEGQLWWSADEGTSWKLLYQHPQVKAKPQVVNMAFAPTNANVLYVIFDIGAGQGYSRIVRLHLNLDDPAQPTVAAYLGAGLPTDLDPESIAGDGHAGDTVYVGTNQGGVYRWDATQPYWLAWETYNRCLPETVEVRDLLVEPTGKELRAGTWGRGAWSVVTGP